MRGRKVNLSDLGPIRYISPQILAGTIPRATESPTRFADTARTTPIRRYFTRWLLPGTSCVHTSTTATSDTTRSGTRAATLAGTRYVPILRQL